jgi:hypothetical protein
MVTMRSRQLMFFAGREEGAGDLNCFGRRRYKRFFQTWFKYAVETTFD